LLGVTAAYNACTAAAGLMQSSSVALVDGVTTMDQSNTANLLQSVCMKMTSQQDLL
jgi:hypothetical protein